MDAQKINLRPARQNRDDSLAFARYLDQAAEQHRSKHGMTIDSQWPKRIPIPGLKLYRMTKTMGD